MFDKLSALGYGLVTFAVIIGVGTILLTKFGDSVATCATDYTYNATSHYCENATGGPLGDTTDPTNAGWTSTNYLNTQLGTTGLAGWAPAIIAFTVGMLFLGVFMAKGGRRA